MWGGGSRTLGRSGQGPECGGVKGDGGERRSELTLCVLEVVPPQWPDLVLTAHIPHCEADVLVFYRLYVKT